jgi:hypothetical protein
MQPLRPGCFLRFHSDKFLMPVTGQCEFGAANSGCPADIGSAEKQSSGEVHMSRLSFRFIAPLAVALITSAGAFAQSTATVTPDKPVAATPHTATAAMPMAKHTKHAAVAAKKAHTSNKVVTATTSTGKTVNYDCSKAGNKTKTACKK